MSVSCKIWLRSTAIFYLLINISFVSANEPLSLETAITTAHAANPGLAAIESRVQALQAIPAQQGALPEPRLSINAMNIPLDTFSLRQEPMTQLQVGIQQTLPYPGKLALAAQAAQHQAQVAHYDYLDKQLLLTRDVKTLWWNIFYLEKALTALKKNHSLLNQIVNIAQTHYEVGQGMQQDVLLAQLELSKLNEQRLRLQQLRSTEEIRLSTLLNHPNDNEIKLEITNNISLPTLAPVESLIQLANNKQPSLNAQQQRINMAKTRITLAKKDYAPDFQVGAAYGLRLGDNPDGSDRADFASILFSMNLPIYTDKRQDSKIDQRNAEWLAQKYQFSDQRNNVASNIQQANKDYLSLYQQVQLYKQEILPQAQQTVEAMLSGYQVGKVDFFVLIRSQTTLYNYETQYWKTISTANQSLARLAAAVGEENIYE